MIQVKEIQVCCGPDVLAEYRLHNGKQLWCRPAGAPGEWEEVTDPDDLNCFVRLATGDEDYLKWSVINGSEYRDLVICVVF